MARFFVLPVVVILSCAAGSAFASGFQLREQDPAAQGTAFAGVTAGTGDLSAMFFNPAAAALVDGTQFEAGGSFIAPTTKLKNASGTYFLGGGAISGPTTHEDSAMNALVPSLYASHEIEPGVHVGISVTAPYGMVTKYDTNWVGRYHALRSKLKTINVTPSVSYEVSPTLNIGGGFMMEYAKADLTNAIDFGTILGVPGAADGFGRLEGSDLSYGFNAGLTWQATPATRMGASFRSRVAHTLKGNATFSGVPAVPALQAAFAYTSAKAKLAIPAVYSFGITHDFSPEWSIMAEADRTMWSSFKELRVDFANPLKSDSVTDENWQDVWFFSLGTEYRPTEKWTLRMGVAYDKSPVPEVDRTPRIPDQDRRWVSLGASYKFTDTISLDGAFTHIFVDDAILNLQDLGPGTVNYLRGDVTGTFENEVDIFSARMNFKF
ncbi:MAG TPA: long-chain fatty acid transporter [Rhodospirillaceae bacterium]|nr:MAG: hypothetical protein A2018_04805 [Alphaproteobacteria bacterium GWF2_58_20]HAU28838.1 long-chain fatty acid transporter [Rhodospirillaceae bacterium]